MPGHAVRALAAFALLLIAAPLPAVPVHDWSKSFAYHSVPIATSIATDELGNVFVIGNYRGNVKFGDEIHSSEGVADIFLVKYDAAGNPLWSRSFGSFDWEASHGVAVDGSGNVIVIGNFHYSVDFGGGVLTSQGNNDIFVAKYDPDGNHLWSQRFGDQQNQEGMAVAADAAGTVAITGWFDGVLDFGGGPLTSGAQIDGYVAKFDADGNHLWSRSFGDDGFQRSDAVAIDAAGNTVITGDFAGTVDFGAGPLTSLGTDDIFLASFDPGGELNWAQQFGDAALQRANSLASDSSGHVVLAGYFYGSVDFGGDGFTSLGASDAYVASFDAAGTHLFSRQFGGVDEQIPTSVAIDALGNIALSGFFEQTIDFGGGALTSEGDHELFVASLDADGGHLWSQGFANVRYDFGSAVCADGAGNVVFSGGFVAPVDLGGGTFTPGLDEAGFLAQFDDSGGHVWSRELAMPNGFGAGLDLTVDSANAVILAGACQGSVDFGQGELSGGAQTDDVILAKFAADGTPLWSRRFGDVASSQAASEVAADAANNIVVAGTFTGSLDFGGTPLSANTEDVYLAKLDADGNHLWSRHFAGENWQSVQDLELSNSGAIVIAGYLNGSVDFGGGVLTSAGSGDAYVACFDASGNHLWSKSFGDASEQRAYAVGIDADDNVFLAGMMWGNVDFGGGVFNVAGGSDIFLASFDANGDYRFSRRFGDDKNQGLSGIALDADGNVVLTGYFEGALNFGGGVLNSTSGTDIFVASFNNTATHRWSRRFGAIGSEIGTSIDCDASGRVVVTGTMQEPVDFGGGLLAGNGNASIFLLALDAGGDYAWAERYEGQYDVWPTAVTVDDNGFISLTGTTYQSLDFGGGRLGGTIFLAHFGDEQVPVRFANFAATLRQRAVELRWDVRSDDAQERFTLTRRDAAQAPAIAIASGNLRAAPPTYLDASVVPGQTYLYQLVIHTADGTELESSKLSVSVPALRATLAQNVPNPFNPKTIIEYTLGERSTTALHIYDAAGRLVTRLDQGLREAGAHRIEWDGTDGSGHALASGVYYYSLEGVRGLPSKKMLLIR